GIGLCAEACPDGGWIVAEARAAAGGYGVAETRVFPLEHIKASRLLTLVPTMLLDYLRADDESNTIIVNAPAWMMGKIADDIAALDRAPPEVLLDVVILEAASTQDLLRPLTLSRSLSDFSASAAALTGELELVWLEGQDSEWQAALDAREEDSNYRVKAEATLRVANGRTARIFAGEQRFIIIESLEEGLTADIEAVDVGTSLDVQPRLGLGDEIVLSLDVSTRSLRSDGGAAALPVVGARRADNVVRVHDGETLVIAGLKEDVATTERRSIPVLGSLPLIGSVFRAPVRESRQTEVAIFVTPHIILTEHAQGGEVVHG
ncbi:MAG: hypothetical protein JXA57_03890, partial [Armatimonadetes bacterium]|nr:hypothetical protein [Armatimonadota bacterium]